MTEEESAKWKVILLSISVMVRIYRGFEQPSCGMTRTTAIVFLTYGGMFFPAEIAITRTTKWSVLPLLPPPTTAPR